MRKVPAVTFHFWAVKILSTAMGEALSDYLVHTISPYAAVGLGFVGFAIALAWQFAMRKYFAPAYWLAVVMVAVFGTMIADAIHIEMGIAYAISAFDCAVALAAIFAIWWLVERTLSIHSINTPRREAFYWATVLATFAMGTALGDLSSYTWHLGWFVSGLMYTALYATPLIAQRVTRLRDRPVKDALPAPSDRNWLVAFWWAYIMTRPLGASWADWLGVPQTLGGLNFGRGRVAIVLTLMIVAWVAYLTVSRVDVEGAATVRARASESGS